MENLIAELKHELIMSDVAGDPWSVTMGCMFEIAAHLYEIGDCPAHWGYKVGWGGNHIEEDGSFRKFLEPLSVEQLIVCGNYVHRVTEALKKRRLDY